MFFIRDVFAVFCTYLRKTGSQNTGVLHRASIPSMFTLIRLRRLRWLGHVRRMEDPMTMLYGELSRGNCGTGRPTLRFKDVEKRDLNKASLIVAFSQFRFKAFSERAGRDVFVTMCPPGLFSFHI